VSALVLLLPPLAALGPLQLAGALGGALARADALPSASAGQPWSGLFDVMPCAPAAAALSAVHDGLDVASGYWLRADPATVVADATCLRLVAVGRSGLAADEAGALATELAPLFAEVGASLHAPHPERWYLRLPADAAMPRFADPDAALGDDLRAHLPSGIDAMRWQRLANEVQVVLHNASINRTRAAAGLPAVNSLWFWGGGAAPSGVRSALTAVVTADPVLAGLASLAGVAVAAAVAPGLPDARLLLDLRAERRPEVLERDWIVPALDGLASGTIGAIEVASIDGRRWRVRAAQRWRFWRRRVPQ
jgi:hypothetical protein